MNTQNNDNWYDLLSRINIGLNNATISQVTDVIELCYDRVEYLNKELNDWIKVHTNKDGLNLNAIKPAYAEVEYLLETTVHYLCNLENYMEGKIDETKLYRGE